MLQPTNIHELLQAKADQINATRNIDVYGKASEYKRLLATCQFKLVVWFNQNKQGQRYTVYDLQQNKNIGRNYIPSFDTCMGLIDHEQAFNTLIDYCLQKVSNITNAMLIVNDFANNEELTIFNFNPRNIVGSRYVQPLFKKDEWGNNFFDGLAQPPLRRDKLRVIE